LSYRSVESDEFPAGTGFTFDDVYRFCGNNCIGRNTYQSYVNQYRDAGRCLNALHELLLAEGEEPISANQFLVCSKYGLTLPEYLAVTEVLARTAMDREGKRDKDEAADLSYWKFVVSNCFGLFEELFEGGTA